MRTETEIRAALDEYKRLSKLKRADIKKQRRIKPYITMLRWVLEIEDEEDD